MSKSEEFEKWRPEVNSGEENSPILSQREAKDVATSISETMLAFTTLEGTASFYITLAKESPQRIFQDSDESTYDSYHCRETDVCRDSTDLDDSDSELSFHARMEVVEYEVASINEDEALYSNDSSSGGDDFFLTTLSTRSIRQLKNCNSDFADTEDSSTDNYDPELSLADYWKCVKCQNRQNNPMFRYCERCYQIRKSHFPPRPRKGNLKRKRNLSLPVSEPIATQNSDQLECGRQSIEVQECDINEIESDKLKFQTDTGHNRYKKRKFNYSTNNNCGERKNSSTTETSTEYCSTESSDTEVENTSNCGRESRKRKISPKTRGSASHRNSSCSSSTKSKVLHLNEDKGKTLKIEVDDKFVNNIDSKAFSSAIKFNEDENNGTQPLCIPSLLSQKDSGFSSVPSSSQEMPGSSSQSDDPQILTVNRYLENDDDSDSTIIEDLNDKHINAFQKNHSNLRYDNNNLIKPLDRSNQIQFSRVSRSYSDLNIEKVSSVKQSTSNCSDNLLNNNSKKNVNKNNLSLHKVNSNKSIENVKTNIDVAESDQCVVCLSEPKNGAFIHTKFAHICCCYRCAVKIWNTRKKCPICNCSVKNVLKLFVH